jgi:hypothetical protein
MALPVSDSVLDREKTIQSQLHAFSFKNEEEKITALSRNLAAARVELEFNDIAHRVFGIQSEALSQSLDYPASMIATALTCQVHQDFLFRL